MRYERAERDHARAEQELAEATEKVERLRAELAAREKAHTSALAEQEKLEQKPRHVAVRARTNRKRHRR